MPLPAIAGALSRGQRADQAHAGSFIAIVRAPETFLLPVRSQTDEERDGQSCRHSQKQAD